MPRYPSLPQHLKEQLALIDPVEKYRVKYFPCAVIDDKDNLIECVYFAEESGYIKVSGVWPKAEAVISIERITRILESKKRLPKSMADKLYANGESGMGYFTFTIGFSGGVWKTYVTGNMVDFIEFPPGLSKDNVVGFLSYH